ncbi:MAG: hypothetical protein LVQ97_04660 [Candidatus Micrarchaeales archaeon]|jgi:hypothetical protein|uniref:SpoVT/AbrB domain protein n=1 Tax=Candidatus Micrarchaeum acidiphilum ARMAN-2 TaxID=425595 RepID=C7DGZ3_MICA2|nr:MAG: hypothetical protein UNLARM2_0339 [Candidatus Micrarchaeum acidiphilum ARMAN-2]MCW6161449.1 hypothetical protein [Candidatus Micrarchaeales archaeon]
MEKHIFKFGKNSLAFIIPKKWADKYGLRASSRIFVGEDDAGNLTVSGSGASRSEKEIDIDSSIRPDVLSRWVGLHYMQGTQALRIHSSGGITTEQAMAVANRISSECSGFEITSQSSSDIIIENFSDMGEVEIDRILMRIEALISQEFIELVRGNPDVVPEIEKLVNRFYMLGMRYTNMARSRSSMAYFSALSTLEDISDKLDEASKIRPLPHQLMTDLKDAFSLCNKAMSGDIKSINRIFEIRAKVLGGIPKLKSAGEAAALLASIAYDTSGLAELGLIKIKSLAESLTS